MCSRKTEHFKRYLQVHNINRLITVKTEFAPRNPHHNGKPFAASLVAQYRRLEILIKRIVWLGAELGYAKRQKRFFVMTASQFTTAVTGRCVCFTTIIPL